MDIRAVLLIGGGAEDKGCTDGVVAGVPIAYLDVLGQSVLERVIRRLRRSGITQATVISDTPHQAEGFTRQAEFLSAVKYVQAHGAEFWEAGERAFLQSAEAGADLVLTLRVGPYVEVDYDELIQHHLDRHCAVTKTVDHQGSNLEVFVLSASWRKDAAALFQSHLRHLRRDCTPFRCNGYVNRLENASDLRRLGVDGLLRRNSVCPCGIELKPGVWVGPWARIHRKARVVAPAYIGAHAKVRAAAVVTRGSSIEHHAEIDCGTVVENATLLPFSRIGAGLDVMHSVVGFQRIAHLVLNSEVEIHDARLVGMAPFSSISRLAGSTAALFAFLPKQIWRGFLAKSHRESAVANPECPEAPDGAALDTAVLEASTTGTEASEFPANLAVARRYGDQ